MKSKIGKIVRQKRPPGQNGECVDTCKCTITINGQKEVHYLGRWGSVEADAEYSRLRALVLSGEYNLISHESTPETSIDAVYLEYLDHVERNGKSADTHRAKTVIRYARESDPNVTISNVSLRTISNLKSYLVSIAGEVREETVDGKKVNIKREWSRQYINKLLSEWKKIIHYGINNGSIRPELWAAVKDFPLVKDGEFTNLRNTERRDAVDDAVLLRTLPVLPPTVADFVKVLRGCGARPVELCRLTVKDISIVDGLAICSPEKHKTARKGKKRFIAFGAAETEILLARMTGKQDDDFIFSPKDLASETFDRKSKERKTKVQPSQLARKERNSQTRLDRFNDGFNTHEIGRALKNAILRYNRNNPDDAIPLWTLYQLRHAAYTHNSEQFGIEFASKIAGHSSPEMARVYDHSSKQASIQAAHTREKGWWE